MISLVIGPNGSGKSAFAENLSLGTGNTERYYIATMSVKDEDGIRRVKRHRGMRDGKGFITLELPYSVDRALDRISKPGDSCILLECMSNLVGNEIYDNYKRPWYKREGIPAEDEFCDALMKDIYLLSENAGNLIIVSGSYVREGDYDKETLDYISLLDAMNEKLTAFSDSVYLSGIDF